MRRKRICVEGSARHGDTETSRMYVSHLAQGLLDVPDFKFKNGVD